MIKYIKNKRGKKYKKLKVNILKIFQLIFQKLLKIYVYRIIK